MYVLSLTLNEADSLRMALRLARENSKKEDRQQYNELYKKLDSSWNDQHEITSTRATECLCSDCRDTGRVDCLNCCDGSIDCGRCNGTGDLIFEVCEECLGDGCFECGWCDGYGYLICGCRAGAEARTSLFERSVTQ